MTDTTDSSDNADQATFWASATGRQWVTHAPRMDRAFAPVLQAVLDLSAPQPGEAVLDIGCGTGASCTALADLVGVDGKVLGVDIAPPLLAMAKARAMALPHVELRDADAATADLGRAAFDLMVSRFGVMFFANSSDAFANIAKALKPKARIQFATWGAVNANPWFTDPAKAARKIVGAPPKVDPDAPGPFALRDIDKTIAMLRDAGLTAVSGQVVDMALPGGQDLSDAAELATQIGPAARAIGHFEAGPDAVFEIREEIAARWAEHDTADGPMIPAAINLFSAQVP